MQGIWIHMEAVPWRLLIIHLSSKYGEKQVAFIMSERRYSDTIFKFWFWQSEWTSAAVRPVGLSVTVEIVCISLSPHVVAAGHTQLLLIFWDVASVLKDWIFNLI